MGKQVNALIQQLTDSIFETLEVISHLSEVELDELSEHPCAMGGTIRDLLNHNIDHERMHTGQVYSSRYSLRKMQFSQTDRMVAETLRARMELIASLIGLPDDALDAPNQDDDWTIREVVEHTLYWERDSINDLADHKLARRLPKDRFRTSFPLRDPIEGELAQNGTEAELT